MPGLPSRPDDQPGPERRPEKVKTLVYLAAFLLRHGESLLQVVQEDGGSMVLPNLVMADDRSCATVRKAALKEIFYGGCSEEDILLARLLLVPEAMAPLATPISISDRNFGRVSRVYIECLRDKAIPPALQKKMYTALPCQKVISMDTDHSPFFSAPEALVTHFAISRLLARRGVLRFLGVARTGGGALFGNARYSSAPATVTLRWG